MNVEARTQEGTATPIPIAPKPIIPTFLIYSVKAPSITFQTGTTFWSQIALKGIPHTSKRRSRYRCLRLRGSERWGSARSYEVLGNRALRSMQARQEHTGSFADPLMSLDRIRDRLNSLVA